MKNRSLFVSAAAVLLVAAALAGCGSTTYFAGRTLPPSGLLHRVMIAVQNPSGFTKGALTFVDANYDIRYAYNNPSKTFSISGFSGSLPTTIQNLPELQAGAVFSSGDNSYALIDYAKESSSGSAATLGATTSSVYMTRDEKYVFSAIIGSHQLGIYDRVGSSSITLDLPGIYRVSVNPGGSAVLAFVENSNYAYYPMKLTSAETLLFSGGQITWPQAAVDCEPQNAPTWCLFQAQSPDNKDKTYNGAGGKPVFYTGAPLVFDRPIKAVFSADGGTAYVLNCGPECGGNAASITELPVSPILFLAGQASGTLPLTGKATTIQTPGGASNALVNSSTLYVVGQQQQSDGLFTGKLTIIDLNKNTAGAAQGISDGMPGAMSRMILADDNTLWIGMQRCNQGERAQHPDQFPQGYGCLTMFDTSANTVKLEPYIGDVTGLAAVTGLHKLYVAQDGQVYIYKTTDGSSLDNQYVTVTGTAYDLVYMDATTDANNTVY